MDINQFPNNELNMEDDLSNYEMLVSNAVAEPEINIGEEINLTENLLLEPSDKKPVLDDSVPLFTQDQIGGSSSILEQTVYEKDEVLPNIDSKMILEEEKKESEEDALIIKKAKKRVRLNTDNIDFIEPNMVLCKHEDEEEEAPPPPLSDDSDVEDNCNGGNVKSKSSFTIEDLMENLMKAQVMLSNSLHHEAIQVIEMVINKCQNRSSLRKRSEGTRKRKVNLESYVHVYCGRDVMGFYTNSFANAKAIDGMVVYMTIKCGLKQEGTSGKLIKQMKGAASNYLYKCAKTHKKHMDVKPGKIAKSVNRIAALVTEKQYEVVYTNKLWFSKLQELPQDKGDSSGDEAIVE